MAQKKPKEPLPWKPFVPATLACCHILAKKTLKREREICSYLQGELPWSGIPKIQFGLYKNLWGHLRPRLLLAETVVGGKKTLIVCFRETKGEEDWMDNIKIFSHGGNSVVGKVHGGFWSRAGLLPCDPIYQRLRDGYNVVFTGFSQGSAVAEVALLRLINDLKWQNEFGKRVLHLGYGSPLVFDSVLAEEHISDCKLFHDSDEFRVGDLFHHFINRGDIVPRILSCLPFFQSQIANRIVVVLKSLQQMMQGNLKKAMIVLIKEVIDPKPLPKYEPIGHYHFFVGTEKGGRKDFITHKGQNALKEVKELLETDVKFLESRNFQQHKFKAYYKEIRTDQELGKLFAKRCNVYVSEEEIFRFSKPQDIKVQIKCDRSRRELKIELKGENVVWVDPSKCHVKGKKWMVKVDDTIDYRTQKCVILTAHINPKFSLEEEMEIEVASKLSDKTFNVRAKVMMNETLYHLKQMPMKQLWIFVFAQIVLLSKEYEKVAAGLKKRLISIDKLLSEYHEDGKRDKMKQDVRQSVAKLLLVGSLSEKSNSVINSTLELKKNIDWITYTRELAQADDAKSYLDHNGAPPFVELQTLFDHLEKSKKPLKNFEYLQAALPALFMISATMQLVQMRKISTKERKKRFAEYWTNITSSFIQAPITLVHKGTNTVQKVFGAIAGGIGWPLALISAPISGLLGGIGAYIEDIAVELDKRYFERLKYLLSKSDPNKRLDSIVNIYEAESALLSQKKSMILNKIKPSLLDQDYWKHFLDIALEVALIRKELLKLRFVVICGPQNVGKTSICRAAFGGKVVGSSREHTRDITAWGLSESKSVFIIDTPASTDRGYVRRILNLIIWQCASVGLLVTTALQINSVSEDLSRLLKHKPFFCPFALLGNRVDAFVRPDGANSGKGGNAKELSMMEKCDDEELLSKMEESGENMMVDGRVTSAELVKVLAQKREEVSFYSSDVWFCAASPEYALPKECVSAVDSDIFVGLTDFDAEKAQNQILLPRGILALTMHLLKESLEENSKFPLPLRNAHEYSNFTRMQLLVNACCPKKIITNTLGGKEKIEKWFKAHPKSTQKSRKRAPQDNNSKQSNSVRDRISTWEDMTTPSNSITPPGPNTYGSYRFQDDPRLWRNKTLTIEVFFLHGKPLTLLIAKTHTLNAIKLMLFKKKRLGNQVSHWEDYELYTIQGNRTEKVTKKPYLVALDSKEVKFLFKKKNEKVNISSIFSQK